MRDERNPDEYARRGGDSAARSSEEILRREYQAEVGRLRAQYERLRAAAEKVAWASTGEAEVAALVDLRRVLGHA